MSKIPQTELDRIVFHHKPTPLLIRIFLSLLLVVCVLIPVIALIVVALSGKGLHIGVLLAFFLFWGLGFMMLRSVLWNSFGKEILYLQDDKIMYEADYKYLKDAKQEINTEGLEVEIIYNDTTCEAGTLRFKNDKKTIETVLLTPQENLQNLLITINTRYNLSKK